MVQWSAVLSHDLKASQIAQKAKNWRQIFAVCNFLFCAGLGCSLTLIFIFYDFSLSSFLCFQSKQLENLNHDENMSSIYNGHSPNYSLARSGPGIFSRSFVTQSLRRLLRSFRSLLFCVSGTFCSVLQMTQKNSLSSEICSLRQDSW